LRFHRGYALAALLVFAVEVGIALYVRDRFVRPVLGEVLAVVLVYLGLRAVRPIAVRPAALAALAIGCAVEFSQFLGLADLLGLAPGSHWRTVIGSQFDTRDLIAYAAGALAILLVERQLSRAR